MKSLICMPGSVVLGTNDQLAIMNAPDDKQEQSHCVGVNSMPVR